MNEKNQQVSDEQIDALIRSGLWQDEQPLTADEEKLADAAFARAMAKIDRKAKRQKRRTVLHMLDRVVRVAACLIVAGLRSRLRWRILRRSASKSSNWCCPSIPKRAWRTSA